VHQNRDNELPTEIKIPEEFDWVKRGWSASMRRYNFQDLAERPERRQQAILTRELRFGWE